MLEKKGKGLWKFLSTLLLVRGEEEPGRHGALQKWTWLSYTVMSFRRLEIFPSQRNVAEGTCESEKLSGAV